MRNLLVLAYHYPPVAGGGVFRTLKFVKYLPSYGWNPTVVSVRRSKFSPTDDSLLKEIPEHSRTIRTRSLESKLMAYAPSHIGLSSKLYLMPDEMISWYPFAISQATKVIRSDTIKVIYSTAPPYTSLLIGASLKLRTGLPLVIDFRDPWTQNPEKNYPSHFHEKIDERMEKKVLTLADRILLSTDINRDDLLVKYPDIPPEKCITMTNGFDPGDFEGIEIKPSGKFKISHTGSFYGRQSPEFFLQAVNRAIGECKELANDLEIIFAGRSSKEYWDLAKKYGLEGILVEHGYVSHHQAIEILVNSSCLLLIIGKGDRSNSVYTGKIFEYMASGVPIIATVPQEGASAKLIKDSRTGVVADTEDVDSIKEAVLRQYRSWKAHSLAVDTDWDIVNNYSRKKQTMQLADIFNELAEGCG